MRLRRAVGDSWRVGLGHVIDGTGYYYSYGPSLRLVSLHHATNTQGPHQGRDIRRSGGGSLEGIESVAGTVRA